MKSRRFVLASLLVLVVIVLTGCAYSWRNQRAQLEALGIIGKEFELRSYKITEDISGNLGGNFFLGSGTISGNVSTGRTLEISWERTPNRYITSRIPLSILETNVDDDYTGPPKVRFFFSERFLDSEAYNKYDEGLDSNPNLWISEKMVNLGNLVKVEITISKADSEKEIDLLDQSK